MPTHDIYHMNPKKETSQQKTLNDAYFDYQKGLNSYAFFKINNHVISDEIVQDTFMKTWKYMVSGGKVLLMKAFLYNILNNLIVDQYRKTRTTSLDAMIENGFEKSGSDPQKLMDHLDGKAAMLLIARLPLSYQKIMRMKYVQDLTLSEMSLLTGKSNNHLAVLIHRGLQKLKQLYSAT